MLLRFTVTGYVLALSISACVLWLFGRLAGVAFTPALQAITARIRGGDRRRRGPTDPLTMAHRPDEDHDRQSQGEAPTTVWEWIAVGTVLAMC